jgi:hypothetical protein
MYVASLRRSKLRYQYISWVPFWVLKITVAISAVILSLPNIAHAMCATPRTKSERVAFAEQIVRTSDVIIEGKILQKYDGSRPEIISVKTTYKGPKKDRWSLWLPGQNDMMMTIESPTSGRPVGEDVLLALRSAHGSLVIDECSARTIFDPEIHDLVKASLTSKK